MFTSALTQRSSSSSSFNFEAHDNQVSNTSTGAVVTSIVTWIGRRI